MSDPMIRSVPDTNNQFVYKNELEYDEPVVPGKSTPDYSARQKAALERTMPPLMMFGPDGASLMAAGGEEDAHAQSATESSGRASDAAELEAMLISGPITPELILYLLHVRMNDLDGQFMEAIGQLNDRTNDAKAVNRKLQAALAIQTVETSDDKANVGMHERVTWNGEPITVGELMEREGLTDIPLNEHNQIDGNALTSHIERLKEEISSLNSGNELAMVGIQTLTQQRAQILSMGSNLLKSLSEQQESIIRNVG